MKPIDTILKRLTILYYVFLFLIVASSIVSFIYGISMAIENNRLGYDLSSWSTVSLILAVVNQFLVIVGSVWVLVLFIRMCIVIGRSLKHKNPFDLSIVKIIYRYIIISLSVTVLSYVSIFMMGKTPMFHSTYELVGEGLSSVSTVVMLLMFCEVLKIGHILKEEQDLTI